MAIIKIPKKKTPSPNVKGKRKAGTRAGLTKAAIAAAGAKLIESIGASEFSLRRLAKELGVGPTTIHFHFEGGIRAVSSAVTQQALAGVTRPYKPKEDPAAYLGELVLRILAALHLDWSSPSSSFFSCRQPPCWIPCPPSDCGNDSAPVAPYQVGYKKPPLHTRFKPGQSGNPSGLAKIPSNFGRDVREGTLQESSREGEAQAGQKDPVGVVHEGGGQGRHYKGNAVQGAGIVFHSTARGARGGPGRGTGATLNGKAFNWQAG